MSTKLKPCPFCSAEVRLSQSEGMCGITCEGEDSSCLGSGLLVIFPVEQKDSAILAWNTRSPINWSPCPVCDSTGLGLWPVASQSGHLEEYRCEHCDGEGFISKVDDKPSALFEVKP